MKIVLILIAVLLTACSERIRTDGRFVDVILLQKTQSSGRGGTYYSLRYTTMDGIHTVDVSATLDEFEKAVEGQKIKTLFTVVTIKE